MLEALVAATATSGLIMLARGRFRRPVPGSVFDLDDEEDLPCPWCRAQTHLDDHRCPTCHRRFG
jgi:hypothetical protein